MAYEKIGIHELNQPAHPFAHAWDLFKAQVPMHGKGYFLAAKPEVSRAWITEEKAKELMESGRFQPVL